MEDAFFRDADLVRNAFNVGEDPMEEDGSYKKWFNGSDDFTRFIHVDLALKRDRAALSMVHCPGIKNINTGLGVESLPVLNVDLVKSWSAAPGAEINFSSIRALIIDLCRRFSVGIVSFDQWQSVEMIQSLKAMGINADFHSVKKTDYDTLMTSIYDKRLRGYWNHILVEDELLKLKLLNGTKIDHPTSGSKDLADSVAGAVFQAVQNILIDQEVEIEFDAFSHEEFESEYDEADTYVTKDLTSDNVESNKIIPEDIATWLDLV